MFEKRSSFTWYARLDSNQRPLPLDMVGMHDVFEIGKPPHAHSLGITEATSRIGNPYISCHPEKIAAIVLTDKADQPAKNKPVTPVTAKLGENVVQFLKGEINSGRLPEALLPIQSGVGSIGNAVLQGLRSGGFCHLNMYTEVMQDAAIGLISCIVPMVSHVDHTEHDVQVIVTEQGIADLRWKSPCERAELLIENCAHPDYRPLLRAYFEEAKKVACGQHTPHDLTKALSWHQRFLETGCMKE